MLNLDRQIAGVLVVACLAAACAGTTGLPETDPGLAGESAGGQLEGFDAAGLLLLMSDQLLFEPFGVGQLFRERPELHERLALTLGRVGDPRGLRYLESMVVDPAAGVRRAAVFSLGLLGDQRALPTLLGATVDMDREVGRLAIGALARLETPLSRIRPALEVLTEDERLQRLLPSLFRFSADGIHAVEQSLAVAGGEPAPELRRWLVFAVGRSGDARGLPRLRRALEHPDPWVQGWAARGLGRLGEPQDVDLLTPLLDAPDSGVVVQVLRSGFAMADSGRIAPPASWLEPLTALVRDGRPWVRLTAIEVAGAWPLAGDLATTLRELAAGEDHSAVLALGSLSQAADVESQQLILKAAASAKRTMRRAAVSAAAVAGLDRVIETARADGEASVRVAALNVLLEAGSSGAGIAAREALLETDPGLRTVALDWLSSNPVAPLDELLIAVTTADQERLPDVRIKGAAALAARAAAEPLERGAAIAAIERLASDEDYLVRRAAGRALEGLERPVPALGTVNSSRTMRTYREIASSTDRNRFVELELDGGTMVIELDCPTAPLTCLSFLQLAQAGYFDGLEFHRVIPDFVAQGGDPRGDGWGGPGFTLRDENSRIPYQRGVVGMARSGTHTAGSQFFLTLSRQPHLDGHYTVFGRVISGDELLDSIEPGDRILVVREVQSP